ncbi:MAG TPA: DUF4058 family protein [Pirellulales bacterium]|nr:DUF4058 family protein [Pirellulales bacterium]
MPIHDWTRVDAGIFHDFHLEWISTIKRALNQGLLPPEYYALAEQVAGGLHPDVLSLERSPEAGGDGPSSVSSPSGAIALAAAPPRVRFTATSESEAYTRKRRRIAIRHASGDHVVAIVEIVSPGNKGSRHTLRSFVEKSIELLDAGIHLLVLDLFPPGPRDPQGIHGAIWSEMIDGHFSLPPEKPLTLVSYSAGSSKRAFIEPTSVGDELPRMPLFLEPEFYVDVPLDASYQSAFDAVPRRWRDELAPPP